MLLAGVSLLGCQSTDQGNAVVEVYGITLYDTELEGVVSADMSYEDSVFRTKEYINVWVAKHVLLQKANEVLTEEEKDKSKQLAEYRSDLLTYEVLNKLALNEVDTFFSDQELEEYYEEHQQDFELTQNIIKLTFYKIPETEEDIDLLWASFRSGDASINGRLATLAGEEGNYFTENEEWVYFDDILKEIPINTYNQEHYLNNNKNIRIVDGDFVYFVKIHDFKIRSSISPFSVESDNIKDILLMKRQKEMVNTIETKLLDEAYSTKKIRTF